MAYLNSSSKLAPRDMTLIGEHTYIVGPCTLRNLDDEESAALMLDHDPVHFFSKLYKDGEVYYSTSSFQSGIIHGKRDSTVCRFGTSDQCQYG